MRPKLFVVLGITIALAATGFATVVSRVTEGSAARNVADFRPPNPPVVTLQQDPEEVTDGAKSPDKIPDKVAYTLLLRFLSNRNTEAEKNSARSYLRMIFGCDNCPGASMTKEEREAAHANIEKLLGIAKDFELRILPVDKEARKLRGIELSNLDPAAKTHLKNLQATKEQVVKQIMIDLPARLGPSGAEKLNRFIKEQFKRRVKIHSGKPQSVKAAAKMA